MSGLTDAISWSGSNITLIFFVVFPEHTKPSYQKPVNVTPPEAVRTYFLEDIDSRIHGRQCHEYDLIFDRVPSDLDLVLVCWIESVIAAGAEIAWFAFEGSFDFNHILAKDVAGQVFAIGNNQGIELAVEDVYRRAPDWADRLSDDLRINSGSEARGRCYLGLRKQAAMAPEQLPEIALQTTIRAPRPGGSMCCADLSRNMRHLHRTEFIRPMGNHASSSKNFSNKPMSSAHQLGGSRHVREYRAGTECSYGRMPSHSSVQLRWRDWSPTGVRSFSPSGRSSPVGETCR